MLESTSDTSKQPVGSARSMPQKAALAALVLAGGLFAALFLAALLSDKTASWQAALPREGMTAREAQASLARAEKLHEASVRPRLITAGFVSERDIENPYRQMSPSAGITATLWTMRSFPELHDALLRLMLDTAMTPKERSTRFYSLGYILASTAKSLAEGKSERYMSLSRAGERYSDDMGKWFAYFNTHPSLSKKGDPASLKTYQDKFALARTVLPLMLADLLRDMDSQTAIARAEREKAKGRDRGQKSEAWGGKGRNSYLESGGVGMQTAIVTLWQKRADSSLLPLVREFLASGEGSLAERYNAVPLIAQKPGLPASEYLFWSKYKKDLASVTRCVGTTPGAYAYLIGCCDNLGARTQKLMKKRGSLVLDGWHGPGVTLTKKETLKPMPARGDKLYLLADMALALEKAPAYDMGRAFPIFAGTIFRYLENQPLVLPLDPANPKDAALIDWYADTGWKAGRTLLFSASASGADAARHWGSVHLFWWPDRKSKSGEEPQFAYLHPESGHFMLGLLPQIRGKAASRFLGPVTGMWFGRLSVDDAGWVEEKYEARPENGIGQLPLPVSSKMSSPLTLTSARGEKEKSPGSATPSGVTYSDATATVTFGKNIREALDGTFYHNYNVNTARRLIRDFPEYPATPKEAHAFVEERRAKFKDWNITGSQLRTAIRYSWKYRKDPKAVRIMDDTFAKKDISAYTRLEQVRRALGLPKPKGK